MQSTYTFRMLQTVALLLVTVSSATPTQAQPTDRLLTFYKLSKIEKREGSSNVDIRTNNNVDECLLGLHDCDATTHSCVDTSESYICADIDECEVGYHNCVANATMCVNTEGSYECEDIDECAMGTHNCHELEYPGFEGGLQCVNEEGGFSCQDVDECALGTHTCTVNELCYNFEGLFICWDHDECETGAHDCASDERCENWFAPPPLPGYVCHPPIVIYICDVSNPNCGPDQDEEPEPVPEPDPATSIHVYVVARQMEFHVNVKNLSFVDEVKAVIQERTAINVQEQVLVYNGQTLSSNTTIMSHGIAEGATLLVGICTREAGNCTEAEMFNWEMCAAENDDCACNGLVRYGASGQFYSQVAFGVLECNNDVFGDPVKGTKKACECHPLPIERSSTTTPAPSTSSSSTAVPTSSSTGKATTSSTTTMADSEQITSSSSTTPEPTSSSSTTDASTTSSAITSEAATSSTIAGRATSSSPTSAEATSSSTTTPAPSTSSSSTAVPTSSSTGKATTSSTTTMADSEQITSSSSTTPEPTSSSSTTDASTTSSAITSEAATSSTIAGRATSSSPTSAEATSSSTTTPAPSTSSSSTAVPTSSSTGKATTSSTTQTEQTTSISTTDAQATTRMSNTLPDPATSLSTDTTSGPSTTPAPDATCKNILEAARGCNLWVRNDLEMGTGYVEGKVCVGGSMTAFAGLSLGRHGASSTEPSCDDGEHGLVVRGDVSWESGTIQGRYCIGGRDVSEGAVSPLESSSCSGNRIQDPMQCEDLNSFESDYEDLLELSDSLRSGPVGFQASTAVWDQGVISVVVDARSPLHAVSLDADLLVGLQAWGLQIRAEVGSVDDIELIVINLENVPVDGLFLAKYFDFEPSLGAKILFNYPGSAPIALGGGAVVYGSLLAPRAALATTSEGTLNGQLVVASYTVERPTFASTRFNSLPLEPVLVCSAQLVSSVGLQRDAGGKATFQQEAAQSQPVEQRNDAWSWAIVAGAIIAVIAVVGIVLVTRKPNTSDATAIDLERQSQTLFLGLHGEAPNWADEHKLTMDVEAALVWAKLPGESSP